MESLWRLMLARYGASRAPYRLADRLRTLLFQWRIEMEGMAEADSGRWPPADREAVKWGGAVRLYWGDGAEGAPAPAKGAA